jgi:Ca2+/H+ antiporter
VAPAKWVDKSINAKFHGRDAFPTCVVFSVMGEALDFALANPLVLKATYPRFSPVGRAPRRASCRALGEPFGMLILTLSGTFIEVMSISAIMLQR